MILNKFAHLYSKPLGNHTLKNIEKNIWKFTRKTWTNHGILFLSEKVGTLILGNRGKIREFDGIKKVRTL